MQEFFEVLLYSTDQDLTISQLKQKKYSSDTDVSSIQRRMGQHNILGWTAQDQGYHYKFKKIKASPYIIYAQGDKDLLNKPIIGIVGPRAISSYGEQVVRKLFSFLRHYDVVTISGLADGVDSLCHELSLEYDIPTIAVLGGGLGYFSKSTKRHNIQRIVEKGGLVLSEFKLGQKPTNYTFPQRNRIIAGLSNVLFVPEASQKSGSLITLQDAIQMHIPVYVAPNSIFASSSKGVNMMLSKGGVSCWDGTEDFLNEYFSPKDKHQIKKEYQNKPSLSPQQVSIMDLIVQKNTCSVEVLNAELQMEHSQIMTELTMLEMENLIFQSSPGMYKVV